MTAGSVPSSAALCTLHVHSSKAYDADVVLRLVIQLCPSLQVKVVRHTGGGAAPAPGSSDLSLQVGPHEHDNLLRQRNSIVRALCGMGLHASMDHKYRLLGGHVVKAFRAQSDGLVSVASAGVMSSIVEWMAIAQDLRSGVMSSDEELEKLWERCESILVKQSYLVPNVPNATVADWDVAVAILTNAEWLTQASKHRNLCRWLRQCRSELVRYGIEIVCQHSKVTQLMPPPAPVKLPMFYNGTETGVAAITAAGAPSNDKTSGKKQSGGAGGAAAAPKAGTSTPATTAKPGIEQPNPTSKPTKADKKKEKGAKDAAPATAPAAPASAAAAAATEFTVGALDIRVGQIIQVWEHETADKLFCEVIDLGTEQRKIASGLRPFYSQQDLENRKVLVLCNLKSRNLVGFPSHGMVLCASNDDHTKVEFVVPPSEAPLGSRVVFDGYESVPPEPESKVAKKKIFEAVAPDLKTNDVGQVVWKGALARIQGLEGGAEGNSNIVKALNAMPNAKVS